MAEQRLANFHNSDNSSIVVFSFESFNVRAMLLDNEPWFVAKDVASALGYAKPRNAIATHCKGASIQGIPSNGGIQDMTLIPEPDLYRLIIKSKLPSAERFEKWVCEEVLPSIRKHGAYMTPAKIEEAILNPDTIIKLATSLKEERLKREQAEQKIEADKPKVVFAESIEVAKSTILIGELAKLIKQSTQYDIGQKRLFAWMRKNGYLIKTGSDYNMPTQLSMNLGLFVIKEGTRVGTSGTHITKTTKVTGKGQLYFIKKFHEIAEIEKRKTPALIHSDKFMEACNA